MKNKRGTFVERALRGTALAALLVGGACGHTHSVESEQSATDAKKKEGDKKDTDKKGGDKKVDEKADEKKAGDKEHASQAPSRHEDKKAAGPSSSGRAARDVDESIPIAKSPGGRVEPGGMKKIQEKRAGADLLKQADVNGKLDEPTRRALRQFQDGKDLPATGVP